MAHTIKCEQSVCHCMLENDPGAGPYCSSTCQNWVAADNDVCPCGHEECGKQRELGSQHPGGSSEEPAREDWPNTTSPAD